MGAGLGAPSGQIVAPSLRTGFTCPRASQSQGLLLWKPGVPPGVPGRVEEPPVSWAQGMSWVAGSGSWHQRPLLAPAFFSWGSESTLSLEPQLPDATRPREQCQAPWRQSVGVPEPALCRGSGCLQQVPSQGPGHQPPGLGRWKCPSPEPSASAPEKERLGLFSADETGQEWSVPPCRALAPDFTLSVTRRPEAAGRPLRGSCRYCQAP